jgi:hypothetical protein
MRFAQRCKAVQGGLGYRADWINATDRNPGHTPTVLVTAAVAVLGVAITAITTDRRQDRQLAHERERQDSLIRAEHDRLQAQLGAEQDRLQAQRAAEPDRLSRRFQHERIMSDLAELQTLLDDAATHFSDAEMADHGAKNHRLLMSLRWGTEPPDEARERSVKLVDERSAATYRALASQERIAMRLGFGTQIREHYHHAVEALADAWDIEHGDAKHEDRRGRLLRDVAMAKAQFIDAARQLIAERDGDRWARPRRTRG